jgi:translocation and assembly module TamA
MKYLTFISMLFFGITAAPAGTELCPGIQLSNGDIELSDTEYRMVCGDPDQKSYQYIPPYQARFFLTGFLQARGYLSPEFNILDNVLHVTVGEKTRVKKIVVESELPEVSKKIGKEIRRRFRRKTITPSLLNRIETESLSLLRQNSYACSSVESLVDVPDATLVLKLKQLEAYQFGTIAKESIPTMDEEALERFYAMRPEQEFNERKLTLTERRMLRSFVVQGTYFLEKCEDGQFSLAQQFLLGPPRTLRYGAGASTEVGPMARVRWSHHRYGSMASQLDANLQASLITQSLRLSANSFLWKHRPRRSLNTMLELRREDQVDFEERSLQLRPHLQWTRDTREHFWLWSLGPSYHAGTYDFSQSSLIRSFSTVALEGQLQWMSHDYEFYDFHPEEGHHFSSNFDFRHPAMGFVDPLLRLESSFVRLQRLAYWGRGSAIAGLRLSGATTWVGEGTSLARLPPSVKFYGGGSDDIRGFRLRSLPENAGLGALTKLSGKLEFRRTNIIRDNFELYTFVDGSHFGERSWYVSPRLYYSPGVGLRWLSPIGLVQSFVSRGYATAPRENLGYLVFLGMGGTF